MYPETLEQHNRYAITRIARAMKGLEGVRTTLKDAVYDGTDALSHDAARAAEGLIEEARKGLDEIDMLLDRAREQLRDMDDIA